MQPPVRHTGAAVAPSADSRQEAAYPEVDGVTHSFVDVPGLRMHVAEAGRGQPACFFTASPSTGGSGVTSCPVSRRTIA
jgi:hypothetical protein